MAYVKNTWIDRIVQYVRRYKDQNGNTLILTPDEGNITAEGTKMTAQAMNNIEQGLFDVTETADEALSIASSLDNAVGSANGLAQLGSDSRLLDEQLPTGVSIYRVNDDVTSEDVLDSYIIDASSSNYIPTMTADTTGNFIASLSPAGGNPAYYAFDSSSTTYATTASLPAWIQVKLDKPMVMCRYSFHTYNSTNYPPNTWYFEGSNDGTNFDILHSQINNTTLLANQIYEYSFENQTAYLYYRMRVTATKGVNQFVTYNIKMFPARAIYKTKYTATIPNVASYDNSVKFNLIPDRLQSYTNSVNAELNVNNLGFKKVYGDILIPNKDFSIQYDNTRNGFIAREVPKEYPIIKWEKYKENIVSSSYMSYIFSGSYSWAFYGENVYLLWGNQIIWFNYTQNNPVVQTSVAHTPSVGSVNEYKGIYINPNNPDEAIVVIRLTNSNYCFGILKYTISTNTWTEVIMNGGGYLNAGTASPSYILPKDNLVCVQLNNGSTYYWHRVNYVTGEYAGTIGGGSSTTMTQYYGTVFGVDSGTVFQSGTASVGISSSPAGGGTYKAPLLPQPNMLPPTGFSYDFLVGNSKYVILNSCTLRKMMVYDTTLRVWFDRPHSIVPTANVSFADEDYIYRISGSSNNIYAIYRCPISEIVKNIGVTGL